MTMNKSVACYKNEEYNNYKELERLLKKELSYTNYIAMIHVYVKMNYVVLYYKKRSKLANLTHLQIDILKEYGFELHSVNFPSRSVTFKRIDEQI